MNKWKKGAQTIMNRIKPSKHYKIKQVDNKRVQVEMTSREVKAFIMKVNKWTPEEYRKNYDIFKNKLRAYEAVQEAGGYNVKKQSVVDVLYYEAKAKQANGKNYKPSKAMQKIRSMSAYSITKGRKLAKEERYQQKQYKQLITKDFGKKNDKDKRGFMYWVFHSETPLAKKLKKVVKEGTDSVKVHQLLSKVATEIEKEQRRMKKAAEGDQQIGTDVAAVMDFDIAPYLS